MQSNGGNLIKYLRKKMGVSQEELAQKLFISRRTLTKVENGTAELGFLDFKAAFQVLGCGNIDDFWIVYLSVEEFEGWLQYKTMRLLLNSGNVSELRDNCQSFKKNPLAKRFLFNQFLSCVNVVIDDEMPDDRKLKVLHSEIEKSIKNFADEKIGEYRLSYNEVLIINELALIYARLEKWDKTISLLDKLVQNVDSGCIAIPVPIHWRTTTEENALLLPKPHVDLATILVESGEYEKAAHLCKSALELIRIYHRQQLGPYVSYLMGVCYRKMNREKQEYMHYLAMSYYTAMAYGQNDLAGKVKEECGIS